MTIQVFPNVFKKIGLLLFLVSIIIPFIDGFLTPCEYEYNEELSLIYPFNFLLTPMFVGGILLFFLAKKKGDTHPITT